LKEETFVNGWLRIYEPTNNSTLSEVESLSDSEWLDVASGRESDSDSIYSSRETDQERTSSRSWSRRSSFSYGNFRDEDVDAWQGLIEDSVDEELVPNTVRLSGSHPSNRYQVIHHACDLPDQRSFAPA
jgi:hypothetical protein